MGLYQQYGESFYPVRNSNNLLQGYSNFSETSTNTVYNVSHEPPIPPWEKIPMDDKTVERSFVPYPYSEHRSDSEFIPVSQSISNSQFVGVSQNTLRYEPLSICHKSLPSKVAGSWFCTQCNCPMMCRIRLVPCFHLICIPCFLETCSQKKNICSCCSTVCFYGEALHHEDDVATCSGWCIANTTNMKGRSFLNKVSLKTHEFFFHAEEKSKDSEAFKPASNCNVTISHSAGVTDYHHGDVLNDPMLSHLSPEIAECNRTDFFPFSNEQVVCSTDSVHGLRSDLPYIGSNPAEVSTLRRNGFSTSAHRIHGTLESTLGRQNCTERSNLVYSSNGSYQNGFRSDKHLSENFSSAEKKAASSNRLFTEAAGSLDTSAIGSVLPVQNNNFPAYFSHGSLEHTQGSKVNYGAHSGNASNVGEDFYPASYRNSLAISESPTQSTEMNRVSYFSHDRAFPPIPFNETFSKPGSSLSAVFNSSQDDNLEQGYSLK